MRLVGILSFYDERPDWLRDAIASIAECGVRHLVAVDGAYALLPGGQPTSPADQHQAIADTCRDLAIGLTLHTPHATWQGNEIEKRTFCFRLAEQIAKPGDWYWSMDADQVVSDCPPDLLDRLATTPHDAARVAFWERRDQQADQRKVAQRLTWADQDDHVRILFRAIPGLHVTENHYTYVTGDGRVLWGNRNHHDVEPALDLTDLRIEHRTWLRDERRHAQQYDYYRRRKEVGVEHEMCGWRGCAELAIRSVPWDWEFVHGTHDLAAGWLEVCEAHVDPAFAAAEQQLEDLGVDVKALFERSQAEGAPMLRLTQGKVPA